MDLDIKKIREKLNLTQSELAEKLGVTGKTVSNWETTGRISTPMKKKLLELANEGEHRRCAHTASAVPARSDTSAACHRTPRPHFAATQVAA